MCPSNSLTLICGHLLKNYLKQEQRVKRILVYFCAHVRGIIIQALFEVADGTQPEQSLPSFAACLVDKTLPYWKPLLKHCNLDCGNHQSYERIIIRAFKNTVKWMERRLIECSVLEKTPEGLKRTPGCEFTSPEAAGQWFNTVFQTARANGQLNDMMTDFESMSLAEIALGT
ncbi:hypothetical protein NM208_g3846 [Fusarium decemcellulare]|uniref:Uncharacterized protein n=1 Tax=Fusarium decemcellulare TaxID=57161 RepID=A0ACC1SML3_9HYPO|nr:hypothetical protein NM208_g3846 [Fusarium decemcellulare]